MQNITGLWTKETEVYTAFKDGKRYLAVNLGKSWVICGTEIPFVSLWERFSKEGKRRFSGKDGEGRWWTLWPVAKKNDKSPDFTLTCSEETYAHLDSREEAPF